MNHITSKDNQYIKEYKKLFSDKSQRKKTGKFVVAGVKVILEIFKTEVFIEKVFVTKNCMVKYNLELEKYVQLSSIYIISDNIACKMTDIDSVEGVFAICRFNINEFCTDNICEKGKYLMLLNLQDAGNVGALFRTAEALNMDGVILSSDTCDVFSYKVIRSSMGSVFRVNLLFLKQEETIDFIKKLNSNNVNTYATVLHKEAVSLTDTVFKSPSVILLGNEGNGLNDDVIYSCNNKTTIVMNKSMDSLNVSIAGSIVMWEMSKQIV